MAKKAKTRPPSIAGRYLYAQRYMREAIKSFENDPPDSDFNRGYLAALRVVWKEAFWRKDGQE